MIREYISENGINRVKPFNVTYQFSGIGTVTIDVPEDFTLEQAIQYAKDHADELPIPNNWTYLNGSEFIDEENCDFDVV